MPEKLRIGRKGFQVWKNPQGIGGFVRYLGEYHPPAGCNCLTGNDLRELGFGPGSYTVGPPADELGSSQFENWITVFVDV